MEEGPVEPSTLRVCPADGQALDLYARIAHAGFPDGAPKLVRAHRLALTKAAVGRRAGLLDLSHLPAR